MIANEAHRFLILEQSAALGVQPYILLEPIGRDTAPAVALGAHYLTMQEDPVMLVMPADHVIENTDAFYAAVSRALEFANKGYLVAFGCYPDYPSSAYGYIQRGVLCGDGIYQVCAFKEKPSIHQAEQWIKEGDCDWNSGIFFIPCFSIIG